MSRSNEVVLNAATVSTLFVTALASLATVDGDGVATAGFGSFLRELAPAIKVRTGLASLAAHKEVLPGLIIGVTNAAGSAKLALIYGGTAGAGEVLVQYNVSGTEPGIPTLTFGDGANTGYQVVKIEVGAGWDEALAAIQV